jgi:hypothetical protein
MWLACLVPGHTIPVTDIVSPAAMRDVIVTPGESVVEVLHGLGPDWIVVQMPSGLVCRLPTDACQTCEDGPLVTVGARYAIVKCFTPPRSFWIQYVGTRHVERVDAVAIKHRGDPMALAFIELRWRAIVTSVLSCVHANMLEKRPVSRP